LLTIGLDNMRRILLVVLGIALWSHPVFVSAAGYFIQPPAAAVGVGDVFDVVVGIVTEGESVNALEGVFTYDPAKLELIQVNTSRSAVNLWIEDPSQVSLSTSAPGSVAFSGVTPGGIGEVLVPPTDGYPALSVFSPRFKALASGATSLSIDAPGMYRNDGDGTAIAAESAPLMLSVAEEGTGASVVELPDALPPFKFSVTISQDNNAFEGKRFAVFVASDKGSGIDYYEVSENGKPFARAVSPYVLEDQEGDVFVKVRAFDRASNVQEASVRIGMSPMVVIGWCILALLALCGFIAVLYRRVWRSRGARR